MPDARSPSHPFFVFVFIFICIFVSTDRARRSRRNELPHRPRALEGAGMRE
jgi:hypothetical protein